MAREPFKSGVTDYEALYKRVNELGIKSPIGDKNGKSPIGDKNGVDVTPQPEAPKPDPGFYAYP